MADEKNKLGKAEKEAMGQGFAAAMVEMMNGLRDGSMVPDGAGGLCSKEEKELGERLRKLAKASRRDLRSSLSTFLEMSEAIPDHFWDAAKEAKAQDEPDDYTDFTTGDLLERFEELKKTVFAPHLEGVLAETLDTMAEIDEAPETISLAQGAIVGLNTTATLLWGQTDEDPNELFAAEVAFRYYWVSIIGSIGFATPDFELPEMEDEADEYADIDFQGLSTQEKIALITEILTEAGLAPEPLNDDARAGIEELGEYLDIFTLLEGMLPDRTTAVPVEPFASYDEEWLRGYYGELWQRFAAISAGEWAPTDLQCECQGEPGECEVTVRFAVNGEKVERFYTVDSSYIDSSLFSDLMEFAERHMEQRYLVEQGSDYEVRICCLPAPAAKKLHALQ